MKFFHITTEIDYPQNGFNFYPLSDKSSVGVSLRVGRHLFGIRYSKIRQKLHFFHRKESSV